MLVTFLATAYHPALGLGVSAVIGLTGAIAAGRPAEHRAADRAAAHRGRPRRTGSRSRALLAVSVACLALGAIFGGMEVAVVAFATESGVLPFTGVILMCWAFGSLLAGVVTGAIHWRVTPARRLRVGAMALAASLVPLPFLDSPAGWRACWP